MTDDTHLAPYLGVVTRVSELARGAEGYLDTTVPTCPDWTARDVVCHLAGLAQDWVSGNLENYASDPWTTAQISRFEGSAIEDVLEAWAEAANQFSDLGHSPLGGTPAMWAFGDAVVHEADVRPVLATGTRVPDEAVVLGLARPQPISIGRPPSAADR